MSDDDDQRRANRDTVDQLVAAGDQLTRRRPVDHFIYFADAGARDRFVEEVRPLGFELADAHDDGDPPHRSLARVVRVDPADLESIHEVVMTLFRASKRHGGDYDGWECPVMRPSN